MKWMEILMGIKPTGANARTVSKNTKKPQAKSKTAQKTKTSTAKTKKKQQKPVAAKSAAKKAVKPVKIQQKAKEGSKNPGQAAGKRS